MAVVFVYSDHRLVFHHKYIGKSPSLLRKLECKTSKLTCCNRFKNRFNNRIGKSRFAVRFNRFSSFAFKICSVFCKCIEATLASRYMTSSTLESMIGFACPDNTWRLYRMTCSAEHLFSISNSVGIKQRSWVALWPIPRKTFTSPWALPNRLVSNLSKLNLIMVFFVHFYFVSFSFPFKFTNLLIN